MDRPATVVVLACFSMLVGSAHAQETPSWLRVHSRHLASREEPTSLVRGAGAGATSSAPPIGAEMGARFRQNRARRILAAGAGLTLSAAIAPAYFFAPDPSCLSPRPPPRGSARAAAVIGGAGLAGLIGGTTWLVLEKRRHGLSATPGQRGAAAGIGVLSFLISHALLGPMFLFEGICD